jgi:hypothetical protein
MIFPSHRQFINTIILTKSVISNSDITLLVAVWPDTTVEESAFRYRFASALYEVCS